MCVGGDATSRFQSSRHVAGLALVILFLFLPESPFTCQRGRAPGSRQPARGVRFRTTEYL